MSKLPICNMKGDRTGEFTLADDLLDSGKSGDPVVEAVTAHRAKQRAGTASTLKRGEVKGGGAKPWRQKGTGRARAGTSRSPVWRGGGVAFGPKPRSFEKTVNKKVARAAFRRAFSEKVAAGDVIVIDKLELKEAKTRIVADLLGKLKADKGALLVLHPVDRSVTLAARNIRNVEVTSAQDVHTYQIVRYPLVVVTKDAMEKIQDRLKKKSRRAS